MHTRVVKPKHRGGGAVDHNHTLESALFRRQRAGHCSGCPSACQSNQVPAHTAESQAMSKELKRRGFRFTGPTTCYALMQSAGLVDDHTIDCFRRAPT